MKYLLICLSCLFALTVPALAERTFTKGHYWVTVSPTPVKAGDVVKFILYSPKAVTLKGTVLGQQLRFYEYGEYYRALLGVPAHKKPGVYPLVIEITNQKNKTAHLPVTFEIAGKDFAQINITLPPAKRKLFRNEKLLPERQKYEPFLATESPQLYWNKRFILPVRGRLTQVYGTRNLINGVPSYHHDGFDIANIVGTQVWAANAGEVIMAETLDIRGKTVLIDHGQGVLSAYFHLNNILVKKGQRVAAGGVIGRLGQSGIATGPHLHWIVYLHGIPVNPEIFLGDDLF